jgi:hypothetical protein
MTTSTNEQTPTLITKGVPMVIEFGDFDNFAEMIPIKILKHEPDSYFKVLIRWQYPNCDRTIDLWEQKDTNIDFDSFIEND